MTPSSTTPLDYDRLREALTEAGAVVAPAELHGGVCGALSAGDLPAARRWLEDCLDDEDDAASPANVAAELDALLATSAALLADRELAFEPLLPGDDAPLDEQVQALALWCQGFLSGVGTTAPGAAQRDGPLGEILRDFAEISRAGLSEDEAAGRGQPDFALAEIHEYVRVSVQIVFDELEPVRAALGRDVH